jgi:hypothetical protein
MTTARYPIHAHLLYAVAYGFGGMTAATLVHTLVGLVTLLGIAGIGWLLAGRVAAAVGAAIFATMPLVLWELGTAYLDLFPVLFTVGAVLCVLRWQRHGPLPWLVVAGALAGFGFAAKMTMGLMIVALGLALVLVGRSPGNRRDRILAGVAFGLGALVVALPWIARSYAIMGTIPGLSILTAHATGSATSELPDFGLGRSPLDLLRIPWALTFQGERFNYEGAGDIGILLLMTLPLALLRPRTRSTLFLILTVGMSYLGWAFTAQMTRYLLPTLALAAALAGIGVASAVAPAATRSRQALALVVPVGLVLGVLAVPSLLVSGVKWGLPIPLDAITGRMTGDEFVESRIGAATALAAATNLLPPDTPVGYIGGWEGAQIYTEARLGYFGAESADSVDGFSTTPEEIVAILDQEGTTPDNLLAALDRLGIDYVIWERPASRPDFWRSTLLSTPFLRDNARILAGDHGGYLFEILPEGGNWGVDMRRNLLQDAGLDTVGEDGPWSSVGRGKIHRGSVTLRPKDAIAQRVAATAGNPYALVTAVACDEPGQRAELNLRWLDDHDTTLETTTESVVPVTETSEQFLSHIAPERTASVEVELSADAKATCKFDEAALYAPS